jgi:hypothetical protein
MNINNNIINDNLNNIKLGKYQNNIYGVSWNINNHTITSSGYFLGITISANSQYQYAITNNRLFVSNNYGLNWNNSGLLNTSGDSNQISLPIISNDGSYVYISVNNILYQSNNYGISFTSIYNNGFNCLISGAINNNNQYQYLYCGNTITSTAIIQYSNNYGSTWITSMTVPFTGIINFWNIYKVFTNNIGNYVAVYTANYYYYSNNYGISFSTNNYIFTPTDISINNNRLFKIQNYNCYISYDFGLTWIIQGNIPNIYGTIIDIKVSNTGEFISCYTNNYIIFCEVT